MHGVTLIRSHRQASRRAGDRGICCFALPRWHYSILTPIKSPGNLTVTAGYSGCKLSPMLSAVSCTSLERCCASSRAFPPVVRPSFWCYLHQEKAHVGMSWLRGSSWELVPAPGASLQGVRSEELRKAEIPPGLHVQCAAHPPCTSFSFDRPLLFN